MFRYLVAHLPVFRLERCGWQPNQLVALIAEEKSAMRVQCATPPAVAQGVRRGMTASAARALVPTLQTEELDADGELFDLDELSEQLLRVSPCIAPLHPDGLVAEIGRSAQAGGERRAGAERAVLERVRIRLGQLGHQANVVVADDPHTARAVAKYGARCTIVPRGGAAQALAPLPLAALELPEAEHALLDGLGIHTVGQLAALPPASVIGRLGPIGVAAHALARGHGQTMVLTPHIHEGALALGQDLPAAVAELEALLFVISALLRDGCARLSTMGQAATRVVLRFDLDTLDAGDEVSRALGGSQDLSLRLGEPTRDPNRILSLLRLRLERFELAGPVERVSLELPEPAPFTGRQRDLFDRARAAEAVREVAARLSDTLGSLAVGTPRIHDTWRPEGAWSTRTLCPRAEGSLARAAAVDPSPVDLREDPVMEWRGFPSTVLPIRPPILLPSPSAVELRARAGVPTDVQLDGRWFRVHTAHGPERLSGEWWDTSPFCREYWALQLTDGRQLWLYREDGCSFVQGWWDR